MPNVFIIFMSPCKCDVSFATTHASKCMMECLFKPLGSHLCLKYTQRKAAHLTNDVGLYVFDGVTQRESVSASKYQYPCSKSPNTVGVDVQNLT